VLLTLTIAAGVSALTAVSSRAADGAVTPEATTDAAPEALSPADARKARIRANLVLQFPQLGQIQLDMADLTPSPLPGLDQGSFTMNGERGQQFLVSKDDKALYLVGGGPLDVSLSDEEIQTALAERAKEEALAAAERSKALEKASIGVPIRGAEGAKVTIVEFSDFQCPYCARAAKTVDEVVAKHGQNVKIVFKHFPLDFHPWAKPAAVAANCAAQQSSEAFWLLHDKYFEHQRELTPENVMAQSKTYLADSGVDLAAWSTCAEDTTSDAHQAMVAAVEADLALAAELGVEGTPSFFVNGVELEGAQALPAFDAAIAEASGES
jgi:protein-disulfide isomerase